MNGQNKERTPRAGLKRRRRLLGLEPFFEGGWLHNAKRSRKWDVEDELVAIAVLGDVTVDLSDPTNIPTEVRLKAYALGRDVDVLVASGTQVELSGRSHNDHLNNEVPSVPEVECSRVLRIEGHTFLGDVTVRIADPSECRSDES
jgi:hypothetical protein